MNTIDRSVAAAVLFAFVLAVAGGQETGRRKAVEIEKPANDEDAAVLGRPLALACDAERVYIADAVDRAIKVFSKNGRFLRSFGRKGDGPGEFSLPSGVAVAGGLIAVADKLNGRVQMFDGDGKRRGGFKVPFAPDRIYALGEGRLLVTANPTGKRPGERLLHAYDGEGREIWAGLEALRSSDPVSDAFRNMILVCPGDDGDLYIIHRSGERAIRRFSGSGAPLGEILADERHAFKPLEMSTTRGRTKLAGFCWAAARDGGFFYLLAPEAMDGGRDLGPGRTVSVLDGQGRLRTVVELPCAVHRFLVSGGRMFAVDEEGDLRIFEVGR